MAKTAGNSWEFVHFVKTTLGKPNLDSVGCLGWNTFFFFFQNLRGTKTRLLVVLPALL